MADEYDFFGYSVVFLCGNWVKWQHHLENEGTREAENNLFKTRSFFMPPLFGSSDKVLLLTNLLILPGPNNVLIPSLAV